MTTEPAVKKARKFVSKRGRPTATQVEAIDESILGVARMMFFANGYANTSMEAVALSAGVSKGTLYSRYAEKSELFNAVVAERLDAWSEGIPIGLADPSLSMGERLVRYGVAFLNGMRAPDVSGFHHLLFAEADRFPELARQLYDRGYNGFIARLANEINEAGRRDGWPVSDAESVADSFTAALLGWFDAESIRKSLTDERCTAFVVRLVAIFMGGRSGW